MPFKNSKNPNLLEDKGSLLKIIIGFNILVVVLFGVVFYLVWQKLSFVESKLDTTQNPNSSAKISEVKTYKNILEVSEFAGSKAITDFGSKLKIDKNTIETIDSPNCQIAQLPPLDNNCYVTLSPGLAGLPKQNIVFTGISFEGNLAGDSKINLELIENQNSTSLNKNTLIDKSNFGSIITLPIGIAPTYSIRMTLWDKNAPIKITKINLAYINTENLTAVSGKINNMANAYDYKGYIYTNLKQSNSLDVLDVKWECTDFYPGIREVMFDPDGSFQLTRDDTCHTKTRPKKWSNDLSATALPTGKWFFVIYKDGQKYQSFPLNIETVDKPSKFDLQLNASGQRN